MQEEESWRSWDDEKDMGQKVEGGAQMMHRAGLLNGVGLQKLSCSSPNGPPPPLRVIFHCLLLTVTAV